jgi:[ribosomal protein S5]-alanine N-acetyltransferase
MKLQSKRLNFQLLSLADLDNIHELHSIGETDEYNSLGIPYSIETTAKIVHDWLEGQISNPKKSYVFCIDEIATKKFIGLIALNIGKERFKVAEVWYKLNVHYWYKGYGTEALQRLLSFGFTELDLHRIEAGCAVDNIASVRVLEKAGMEREGLKRRNLPIRGEWKDSYSYAILEVEFRNCTK